jgi:hypothetical protein
MPHITRSARVRHAVRATKLRVAHGIGGALRVIQTGKFSFFFQIFGLNP